MSIHIGIDPGLTGAVAVLDNGTFRRVEDLPIMPLGKGQGRVKNQINAAGLSALLCELADDVPDEQCCVVMEKVSSMPDQGIAGAFSLGHTLGVITGVVAALGFRLELVTPQSWKKHYKLPAEKDVARMKAIQLYPAAPLALKKHHNRADAILIGRYGWQMDNAAQHKEPF